MFNPFHHHHYHRRVCIGLHICKNYYEIMVNLTVATKMQLMSCLMKIGTVLFTTGW